MDNKDNTTNTGSTTGQPSVNSLNNEPDKSVQQSEDNKSSKDTVIFIKLNKVLRYIDPVANHLYLSGPDRTTIWSAKSNNGVWDYDNNREQELFVGFDSQEFSEEELTEFRNDMEGLGDFSVYNP
ncbi:hypothetical protein V865_008524 [Kwoniella europaea PYCC6329]|uniref:Uncharacterized protein n=1 Tax=Kwoniella europaea PYCC6329 TaxID=1423913 RepID=A0AAX4KWW7_9TREE